MTTGQRSATAVDRLAQLTDEYIGRQSHVQKWRVLSRAAVELAGTYLVDFSDDTDAKDFLANVLSFALDRRNRLHIEMEQFSGQMDTLNAQIQNGVYDDERN